jgi:hypothetical protein
MPIPITIRCECGETRSVDLGDRVTCACGRHYDTSTLPSEKFDHVRAKQARIRLYLRLGVICVIGASVAAALVWGLKGLALALPLSCLLWFLFLGKWLRKRWLLRTDADSATLKLEASDP